MRKYSVVWSFWLGTTCAVLALFARGLDMFGKNFIDFNTGGGGIGFHSLMDAALFFLAISFGNASYRCLKSEEFKVAVGPQGGESIGAQSIQTVTIWGYWLGSVCAALGCLSRGLDLFGKNFIDFNTRGSGIGYHSMMDGTLFFYAISTACVGYLWFVSQELAREAAENRPALREEPISHSPTPPQILSNTES